MLPLKKGKKTQHRGALNGRTDGRENNVDLLPYNRPLIMQTSVDLFDRMKIIICMNSLQTNLNIKYVEKNEIRRVQNDFNSRCSCHVNR